MTEDDTTSPPWIREWRSTEVERVKVQDIVNHPPHYATAGVECIDALQACLSPEEFKGFLKGNVIKYLWRLERKGKPLEDAKKSQWYLNRLIATLEKEAK